MRYSDSIDPNRIIEVLPSTTTRRYIVVNLRSSIVIDFLNNISLIACRGDKKKKK